MQSEQFGRFEEYQWFCCKAFAAGNCASLLGICSSFRMYAESSLLANHGAGRLAPIHYPISTLGGLYNAYATETGELTSDPSLIRSNRGR